MSLGGGGGETTTSTEPWDALKPYLKNLFAQAGGTFEKDTNRQLTPGLVNDPLSLAGMSPQERLVKFRDVTGMTAQEAARLTGLPIRNMISSGGVVPFTKGEQAAMDMARGEAGTTRQFGSGWTERTGRGELLSANPWTQATATGRGASLTANPWTQATDTGRGEYLEDNPFIAENQTSGGHYLTANPWTQESASTSGQFLSPDSNPWLRQTYEYAADPLLESFNERILPGLRSQFTMSGHSASGDPEQFEAENAAGDLTRTLGGMSANIYGNAYQMERQLMEQALGRQQGAYETERAHQEAADRARQAAYGDERAMMEAALARQQQAYGDERGLQEAALARQQQAYGDERAFQEAAIARMPSIALAEQQHNLRNIGLLEGVGSAERGLAQQYAGLVNQAQMEPWQQIQNLQQVLQPGLQGFSESSQPYYSNPLLGGIGGLAAGAGAGSMIGGPLGAGIGGGLGLLAGFF